MAKVKLNPVLEQLRGQVGDLVFKRYGDEVVISRKPDLEGIEPSEALNRRTVELAFKFAGEVLDAGQVAELLGTG